MEQDSGAENEDDDEIPRKAVAAPSRGRGRVSRSVCVLIYKYALHCNIAHCTSVTPYYSPQRKPDLVQLKIEVMMKRMKRTLLLHLLPLRYSAWYAIHVFALIMLNFQKVCAPNIIFLFVFIRLTN